MNIAGKIEHAIGIDIGGTKMAVALVNPAGAVLRRTVLPTEAVQGFGRAVQRLAAGIEELLDGIIAPAGLAGIGIGCAGPIDPLRGLINNPYTLTGWNNCDIVAPLRDQFEVPVHLENDADVAALGECGCGVGRGFDPVVMLTFGTGIGGAAVVKGEIYRGFNGEHPELGHIPIDSEGPKCYCGIRGCLESVASGSAIGTAGQAAGFADARAVFAAAHGGHARACAVVERAVAASAKAAWTICHTFLPQCLILGGGIMEEHFDVFAQGIRGQLAGATQFSRAGGSIAQAILGNDAGIVGAGILAFKRIQQA